MVQFGNAMEMCWCESPGPVTGRGAVFADGGPASSAAVSEDCWLCCAALEEGASAAYRPAQHGEALNADVKLSQRGSQRCPQRMAWYVMLVERGPEMSFSIPR